MVKTTKTTKKVKPAKKVKVVTSEDEFKAKVIELKKSKSEKELLEIVSVQPFNHELNDFMVARKALDELGVEYSMTCKVSCEERIAKGE